MLFENLNFDFFIFGFSYMALGMQLFMGFPSFYWKSRTKPMSPTEQYKNNLEVRKTASTIAPLVMAIFIFVGTGLLSKISAFLHIAGVCALGVGILVRQYTFKKVYFPREWVMDLSPTIKLFATRWPMSIFDIWTLGISGIFISIKLL